MRQIACAGAVVIDSSGALLLVQRKNPPGAGLWSLPGGRCEIGEPPSAACVREAREESGLEVVVDRELGTVIRPGREQGTEYVITDFLCRVAGGELSAGDDAADVAWVPEAELSERELTSDLRETLIGWGVVHADSGAVPPVE